MFPKSERPYASHQVISISLRDDVSWYFELDCYDGRWLGVGLARRKHEGSAEYYPLDISQLPQQWATKMRAHMEALAEELPATMHPLERPLHPLKGELAIAQKNAHLTQVCPQCGEKALLFSEESHMELASETDTGNYLSCEACAAVYPFPSLTLPQQSKKTQSSPVQVVCPRCRKDNLCSPVPSLARVACSHCKTEFDICVGTLVGGNRVTIPGYLIGTVHEEFRARIAGLDGQSYHFQFEVPGVGFDVSGGDLISLSFIGNKARLVKNHATGGLVTISSGGCLLPAVITVLLSTSLVGLVTWFFLSPFVVPITTLSKQ